MLTIKNYSSTNPSILSIIINMSSKNNISSNIVGMSEQILTEELNKTGPTIGSNLEPNLEPNSEPKYVNIVLSGGSIKGISLIGGLSRLAEEKLIDFKKIKALVGSSAGSLFGLLVVLGFTVDEIWNFIYCLDMGKVVCPNFMLLLKKCGVETGQVIHNLVEEIITKKTGTKHINFKQLYEITGIHYTVVGTCLTTKEVIYYDHINTPTFKVSMAIRISISIPGFFTPVTIDDKKYIDGAVLNNYAMNLFEDQLDKTIGLLICDSYNTEYNYPEEYFLAIMNIFMYSYYQKTMLDYKDNTVYIDKIPENLFSLNFDIDDNAKIALFQSGILAAEEFINRNSKSTENQV